MKHLFVINPHSFKATNNMVQVLTEIESCFSREHDDEYNIHISRYSRDAIAVVHRYISACHKDETVRIYAIGGDGILFECLNGMIGFSNAELTGVPYGNANDFARMFGESEEVITRFKNIRELSKAPAHPIDIIDCGTNHALLEINIGLIGQTIIHANTLFPRLPAKWLRKNIGFAYTLSGIRAVANHELMKQYYNIAIDGYDISGNYSNIHVANTAVNGGSLIPSPYAIPDDGILNVVLASTTDSFKALRSIKNYTKGLFEKYNFYTHKTFKTMEISSDKILHVEMDGEGFFAKELKINIIPGGVKIFAPEGLDCVDYSYKAYKPKIKNK